MRLSTGWHALICIRRSSKLLGVIQQQSKLFKSTTARRARRAQARIEAPKQFSSDEKAVLEAGPKTVKLSWFYPFRPGHPQISQKVRTYTLYLRPGFVRSSSFGRVQYIIGYNFKDVSKLSEALRSAGCKGNTFPDGNKRLAIIGDRVLDLVLAESWYHYRRSRGVNLSVLK